MAGAHSSRHHSSHHHHDDANVYGLNVKKGPRKRGIFGPSSSRSQRRSSRKRSKAPLIILLVLLAILGGLGFFGYRFYQSAQAAMGTAREVVAVAKEAKAHADDHDLVSLYADVETLSQKSKKLERKVSGRMWDVVAKLPGVGTDVNNAQILASAAANLSESALPLLGMVSGQSGDISSEALLREVSALAPALDLAAAQAQGMKEGRVDQLNEAVTSLKDTLPNLAALSHLVGTEGSPRSYLVLAQTNAEIRSTGGFIGSWGSAHIDNGKIDLGHFSSRQGIPFYKKDVGQWFTEDEESFLGTRVMGLSTSINVIPDFSHVGMIAANYWKMTDNETVNGTIAVDPVFLQSVLALTGGVTTEDGIEVTGDNAAQIILHDIYNLKKTNAEHDAFFAEVAQLAFQKLTDSLGDVDLPALIDVITEGAEDGRLMVWMADVAEQRAMVELGLAGEVPNDPTAPQVGIYVTNWGWSKIEWYLDLRTDVGEPVENEDGSKTYHVTTTVHNTMTPEDDLKDARYIHTGNPDASSDTALLELYLFVGPEGGSLTDLALNGEPISTEYDEKWDQNSYGKLYNKDAWQSIVDVPMGETAVYTYTVTTAPTATEPLKAHMTATCQSFE